jgi:hypothetical protein
LGGSGVPVEREGKNEAICLCRLGPGRTRGTRGEDACAVWADAFRAKSETKMGARGQDQTVLSVWVRPLGCHFPILIFVRMRSDAGGHLRRPTEDALIATDTFPM